MPDIFIKKTLPIKNQNKPCPELPEEILQHMFSFLSERDLGRVARVSKTWKRVSESNEIWKNIAINEYPGCKEKIIKSSRVSKETYRNALIYNEQIPRYAHSKYGVLFDGWSLGNPFSVRGIGILALGSVGGIAEQVFPVLVVIAFIYLEKQGMFSCSAGNKALFCNSTFQLILAITAAALFLRLFKKLNERGQAWIHEGVNFSIDQELQQIGYNSTQTLAEDEITPEQLEQYAQHPRLKFA